MNVMKKFFLFYLLYAFVSSVLIFALPKNVSKEYTDQADLNNYYSSEQGVDRAIILDNPLESGLARLYLIENAKESLDVAYFSIERGETPNVFLGALFDAADRGVKVNILLDGVFHGLRGPRRSIIYAMANHPNMHLKFYEKINPLMPWTVNNRMHDKYIIVDNKAAIIGGRNIGDKYFAPEWYKKAVTNDRDVVIVDFSDEESLANNKESVIKQMSKYFTDIWNHKYSKDVHLMTKSIFRAKAADDANSMREKSKIAREMYKEQFDNMPDLYKNSLPTNKVTFIHNPIERFSKEPWCWHELVQLSKSAKDSVLIQSPYIIPNKKMTKGFINAEELEDMNITFLTNSLASTPNLLAFSGYLNYRKKIVDSGIRTLEIQSKDSIHSKAFVIDAELVAIGSFNLDSRSAFLSTESMVVIHSKEVVEGFGMNILNYTDESLAVDEDYNYKKNPSVEELDVSTIKRVLTKALAKVTRFFDYLL